MKDKLLIDRIQYRVDEASITDGGIGEAILKELLHFNVDRFLTVQAVIHTVNDMTSPSVGSRIALAYLCTLPVLRDWLLSKLSPYVYITHQQLGNVIVQNLGMRYREISELVKVFNTQRDICPIVNPSFSDYYASLYRGASAWTLRGDGGNHIFDDLKTTVEESNMSHPGALDIYVYCKDTGAVYRDHKPIHVVESTPLIF